MTDTLIAITINGLSFFAMPEHTLRKQMVMNEQRITWQIETQVCNERLALRDNQIAFEREIADNWRTAHGLAVENNKVAETQNNALRGEVKRLRRKAMLRDVLYSVGAAGAFVGGFLIGKSTN